MKRIAMSLFVVIFLVVGMVASATAFEVKLSGAYLGFGATDKYLLNCGFVYNKGPNVVTNAGIDFLIANSGIPFLDGQWELDYWNSTRFENGVNWPTGDGLNETDWSLFTFRESTLFGKKLKTQVGFAFFDLEKQYKGFEGDYFQFLLDFALELYKRENFTLWGHGRSETSVLLAGKGASVGTATFVGLIPEYTLWKLTFSGRIDIVADDGLISSDSAAILLLRPAVSIPVYEKGPDKLTFTLSGKITDPLIGGKTRDGLQTAVEGNLNWYHDFLGK